MSISQCSEIIFGIALLTFLLELDGDTSYWESLKETHDQTFNGLAVNKLHQHFAKNLFVTISPKCDSKELMIVTHCSEIHFAILM